MDKNIVKTRLGHYFTPGAGAQTALVVAAGTDTVNLVVWESDGDSFKRLDVPISTQFVNEDHATFHLVSACMPPCPEAAR